MNGLLTSISTFCILFFSFAVSLCVRLRRYLGAMAYTSVTTCVMYTRNDGTNLDQVTDAFFKQRVGAMSKRNLN